MSETSSTCSGSSAAGQPCGESEVWAREKRFSRSQPYGFHIAERCGYRKRDTTLSVLRSSSLKSPLFGWIHRRSLPVITRGGASFRVLRAVLVVRSVIAAGVTSCTLEALVFEIDIFGYCAAICERRQHCASSVSRKN